jgi:hypothetical protein
LAFEKIAIFAAKLAKIAENCDHNIDPRFLNTDPVFRQIESALRSASMQALEPDYGSVLAALEKMATEIGCGDGRDRCYKISEIFSTKQLAFSTEMLSQKLIETLV